jgi:CBS domain-containing protein
MDTQKARATNGAGGTAAAAFGGGRVGVGSNGRGSRVPSRFERDKDPAVAELMSRPAPIIPWQLTVAAARKIAALRPSGILLVEADGVLVGMLDSRALELASDGDPVTACMKSLRLAVRPTMTAERARELLIQQRLAAMPVVVGRFVVGTITRESVERSLARPDRAAASTVKRAAA